MATTTWQFTDSYLTSYPALGNSILNYLVFDGTPIKSDGNPIEAVADLQYPVEFTGILDVTASNGTLTTLAELLTTTSPARTKIAVSGTIDEEPDAITNINTLTIEFQSTDTTDTGTDTDTQTVDFQAALATLPSLGSKITAGYIHIKTEVNGDAPINTESSGTEPPSTEAPNPDPVTISSELTSDQFDLCLEVSIGSATVTIASQIPINGGMLNFKGGFDPAPLAELTKLNFLMGALSVDQWFPTDILSQYYTAAQSFSLLDLTYAAFVSVGATPNVRVTSIGVNVGLTNLPLLPDKLYMDPLSVLITVSDTSDISVSSTVVWGLEGSAKLYHYAAPVGGGDKALDFEFDFAMNFPNGSKYPDFSFSGHLSDKSDNSVNVMLKDLISEETDVGLADNLTVNSFDLDTTANTTHGTISSFSTAIVMSGGFGLFENIELEEIAINVDYEE